MARKGSKKALSVQHEDWIARHYDGIRSRSSGAAVHDQGDVRVLTRMFLIECKYTGSPGSPLKRRPTLLADFEKITDEAWSEGRDPLLALRYFWPDSPLADTDGYVDLVVRRVADDVF